MCGRLLVRECKPHALGCAPHGGGLGGGRMGGGRQVGSCDGWDGDGGELVGDGGCGGHGLWQEEDAVCSVQLAEEVVS